MIIECPKCKCQLEILPEHYGRTVQCPNCQSELTIPNLPAVEPKRRSPLRWIVPVVSVLLLAAGTFAYLQLVQRPTEQRKDEEAERIAKKIVNEMEQKAAETARIAEDAMRKAEREDVEKQKLEIKVEKAEKEREAVEKQVAEDREYMDRLHEISKFSTLSAPAQEEVKFLVKILSSRYGDLGITINPTLVRLEGMDEAEKRFSERAKQIRIAAVKKQLDALKVLSEYQMKKAMGE